MHSLLFILFIGIISSVQAQRGFELTSSSSANFSFLVNNNDFNNSTTILKPSFGSHTNITIGHNFNNLFGISTGLGFSYVSQQYLKASTASKIKALQEKTRRELTYIRLPLFFKINSNPNLPFSFFMRLGPHLDILTTATSTTKYPFNLGKANKNINYQTEYDSRGEVLNIFNNFLIGLSLDVGVNIQLNDEIGLLVLAHMESSLNNVEGKASSHYFPSKFKHLDRKYYLLRSKTWIIMPGLSIGIIYKPFRNGINYQKKRRYRTHYWS